MRSVINRSGFLSLLVLWLGPCSALNCFGQVLLSKEYIYLGDRIIAVESISADATAPHSLVAAATSSTQVNLTWSAPTAGTPDHYGIFRKATGGNWSRIGSTASTNYPDSTVSSAAAYLYKVAVEDAGNQPLSYSNIDLATTIVFTDDPITAQTTEVKAVHVTQLRTAVNAVRALAGLGSSTWTNDVSGALIYAIDVSELRSNLDPALISLGLTAPTYTDTSLSGITIKKTHIEQLRGGVK